MKGLRSFLLLLVASGLLVSSSGCAANRAGFITLSQPKVWHDNAIVATTGEQLKEITDFRDGAEPTALQGRRLRSFLQVLALTGTFRVTPSSPGTPAQGDDRQSEAQPKAVESFPDQQQSPVLALDDLKKFLEGIQEDPFDGLQRVDDFYQMAGGLQLTHLRDTASMRKRWSMYLVGFDISLVPGDKTSEGYGAYVELQVKVDPKDTNEAEDVYVYSVWPQRYADRFEEALSVREDFYLTLTGKAQSAGWSAQMAQDLAQRHQDDLALIQRYPLISGFIKGPRRFGWEFNPRLRIVTKRRWILPDRPEPTFWLESGLRHCYALVAVKDGRIEVDKTLAKLGKEDLEQIAKHDPNTVINFKGLMGKYADLLKDVFDDQEAKRLRTMLRNLEKQMEKEASSKDVLRERFRALKLCHGAILGLCGRQGKKGIKSLKFTAECHWFDRRNGTKVRADSKVFYASNSMTVELPDKLDRTLEDVWAVWPNEGPSDKETTVTIRGQNFGNDARVFVGGKEVRPEKVTVVGRRLVVATFPPLGEVLVDKDRTVSVKVITGGESLSAGKAFTYYIPEKHTTQGAHPSPGLGLEELFRKIGDIVVTFSVKLPKDSKTK